MNAPLRHELFKPRGGVMEMPGVGILRRESLMRGDCTAEPVDGRVRTYSVKGAFNRTYLATEPSGAVVAEYRKEGTWRRDGPLTWYGIEYQMLKRGTWAPIYALARAERDILTLKPYSFGKRRLSVRFTGVENVEPGLELFCAWLVWRFTAEDNAAASSSG